MPLLASSYGRDDLVVELDVIPQVQFPPNFHLQTLQGLIESVLRAEGESGVWSIAVVFTDDDALRALHRDFMGLDTETDVMTFPSDVWTPVPTKGGDIVISVERAAYHAADMGHSTWEESRFLIVHGLLHLCGWEDGTNELRDRMLGRQRELLDAFDESRSTFGQ